MLASIIKGSVGQVVGTGQAVNGLLSHPELVDLCCWCTD